VTLTSGTCSISSVSGGLSTSSGCSVTSNKISLTNPFGGAAYYASYGALTFTLSPGGYNPTSNAALDFFTISTFDTVGGVDYFVDTFSYNLLYTPWDYPMTGSVTPSSYVSGNTGTTYVFAMTNYKYIPTGGGIIIVFPTAITLTSTALTSCTVVNN
jgi:hypothetical protein